MSDTITGGGTAVEPGKALPENDVDRLTPDGRGIVQAPPMAEEGVEFISKSLNLRLIYQPAREKRNHWGDIEDKRAEQAVEFQQGRFVVGPDQQFEDGTSVLEFLRGHSNFNREFAGFVEVTPITPAPSAELIQEITVAAITRNEDRLSELWEAEQSGYQRDEVLSGIRKALDALEQVKAAEESDS